MLISRSRFNHDSKIESDGYVSKALCELCEVIVLDQFKCSEDSLKTPCCLEDFMSFGEVLSPIGTETGSDRGPKYSNDQNSTRPSNPDGGFKLLSIHLLSSE